MIFTEQPLLILAGAAIFVATHGLSRAPRRKFRRFRVKNIDRKVNFCYASQK